MAASTDLTVNLTTLASLQSQGVAVFNYPLTIQLVSPLRTLGGAFEFTLTGPPAVYTVLVSPDLVMWSEQAKVTNQVGRVTFTDAATNFSRQKLYRVRSP
jgi:hypothetical protein